MLCVFLIKRLRSLKTEFENKSNNQHLINSELFYKHDKSRFDLLTSAIQNIENDLKELRISNNYDAVGKPLTDSLKRNSDALIIAPFYTQVTASSVSTNDLVLFEKTHNDIVHKRLIFALIRNPILHNRMLSLEDLGNQSIAMTFLSDLRQIGISSIGHVYLSLYGTEKRNVYHGSMFIFKKSHDDENNQIDTLARYQSILLGNHYILNNLYEAQTERFMSVKRSNIEAHSILREIRHDINNAIINITGLANKSIQTNDHSLRIKIYKQIKGSSQLITSNLEKISWAYLSGLKDENTFLHNERSTWINTIHFFKEIFDAFTQLASNKRLNYIIIIDDNLPDKVRTKPSALAQALFNLLSNSIKYTPRGNVVFSICATEFSEIDKTVTITCSIADTGIGLSDDNLKQIFNEGFRVSNPEIKGSGIGLHICQKAVNLISGNIEVNSTLNQGSTFTLRFDVDYKNDATTPCTQPDSSLSTKKDLESFLANMDSNTSYSYDKQQISVSGLLAKDIVNLIKQRPTSIQLQFILSNENHSFIKNRYSDMETVNLPDRTLNIAMVDDQQEIINYWIDMMLPYGISIHGFNTLDSALKNIIDSKYDLIISDYNLDSMNKGTDLYVMLREADIIIPFILLSADAGHLQYEAVSQLGLNRVFSKTIDPNQLAFEIEEIITTVTDITYTPHFIYPTNNPASQVNFDQPVKNTVSLPIDFAALEKKKKSVMNILMKLGNVDDENSLISHKIQAVMQACNDGNQVEFKRSFHDIKNLAIMLSMKEILLLINKSSEHNEKNTLFNYSKVVIKQFCNAYLEIQKWAKL